VGGRVKGRVAPAGGAVGALDAAARERIMPGGRAGRRWDVRVGLAVGGAAFLYGVTCRGSRQTGPGAASLT
jgi:hypothetical protein